MTRNFQAQREPPDFKDCVWQKNSGTKFVFEYVNQEFIWNIFPLLPQRKKTVCGVVVQQSLVVTRSQALEQTPLEEGDRQRTPNTQLGHTKVARANRVKFINHLENILDL